MSLEIIHAPLLPLAAVNRLINRSPQWERLRIKACCETLVLVADEILYTAEEPFHNRRRALRAMTASAHDTLLTTLLITCEHGGNRIPAQYRQLFRPYQEWLNSHRGFDPGALTLARGLARTFAAPLLTATVSRLLVDLNRSISHPRLHLAMIRNLPEPIRRAILERYYLPYRHAVERLVSQAIAEGRQVIHISCHSFTPELNGMVRNADIGLLYNPARPGEKALCACWKAALKVNAPDIRVRRNYPYEGRNDGLTSTLRKQWPPEAYLGIEVEINQKFVTGPGRRWSALRAALSHSLQAALGNQSARNITL